MRELMVLKFDILMLFTDVVLTSYLEVAILVHAQEVSIREDILKRDTLFLERYDELLGMAPALCRCARVDRPRDLFPIAPVHPERFQEAVVLEFAPAALIDTTTWQFV